ncbi:MAG: nickel-dependent lactate racemase [Kiritimatiellae bacterium]|nr:nickel-dependent lactate racemase [Kiritimatiellia bacterium]MDD4623387.1 nickel-dependent lactate racemase [Kiritimatiellia bacterium]
MIIPIQYGKKTIRLDIPDKNLAFDMRANRFPAPESETEEIRRCLARPVGTGRMGALVPKGASVVILGDDRTRMTPQHKIVPVVLNELNAAGVKDAQVRLIIAVGTHRPMTAAEIRLKYGDEVLRRVEVINHDCNDRRNLVDKGVTRRGTRILVSKDFMLSDFRIGIGGVLPHHPVGWSGGAKILLPGVAGQETVCAMHLLGATEQQLGKVVTPCREEMEDFAREAGLDFIVNVVMNERGRIVKAVSGHFIAAHREAVKWGMKVFGVKFRKHADITLSSTYPADYDLTQSDKGLFSAELATRKGGEIILVSPCPEGIAPTHGEEMAKLGGYDDETLWAMLKQNRIHDRFCASECMYLNHIKRNFKATLMMDPVLSNVMGFHYLSASDLPDYVAYRLRLNNRLKIGIIHQSGEILPIPPASGIGSVRRNEIAPREPF